MDQILTDIAATLPIEAGSVLMLPLIVCLPAAVVNLRQSAACINTEHRRWLSEQGASRALPA